MNVQNVSIMNLTAYENMANGYCRNHAPQAAQVVKALSALSWLSTPGAIRDSRHCFEQMPPCGCLPAPKREYAGAPAGKGLGKDPKGFPKGSIRTAGGYTVVPAPNEFRIYGPGQKHTDRPMTHVWGDPHVNEGDGGRWDFTKNSNFRLPDGTLIYAKTTAQKGASVTENITVVNGNDRVKVSGINTGHVNSGDVARDGYLWRSEHLAKNRGIDNFTLGGTDKDIRWYKSTGGRMLGEVKSSYMGKDGAYQQKVDGTKQYFVDPQLRPVVGSRAWGNQLRGQINDQIGRWAPAPARQILSNFITGDHLTAQLGGDFGGWFGGLGQSFGSLGSAWNAVSLLGREIMAFNTLASGMPHRLSM